MRFIIGEDTWTWLSRIAYRGVIGIFYETTLGGLLAYILFAIIMAMTIVGIITTVKWLIMRDKKKKWSKW